MRHELESGAWVEMTPLQDLRGKDRDRYERAIRFQLPYTEGGDLDVIRGTAERLNQNIIRRNAALACFVTAWSFTRSDGEPLPVPGIDDMGAIAHPEVIGDYPIGDEDEIEALIGPYLAKLRRPDPKRDDYIQLERAVKGTGRLPEGLSAEDWEDIQYLIRFPTLTREVRAQLPVGVVTWLMPTAITLDHVRNGK